MHPDDERYRDLVGKHAVLPLVGRRIPIVADDYADPATGSPLVIPMEPSGGSLASAAVRDDWNELVRLG